MATFVYEASNKEGAMEKGKFETESKLEVIQFLEKKIPFQFPLKEKGRLKVFAASQ